MKVIVLPVKEKDLSQFKKDMQEAFQKGAENEFGKINEKILKDKDIEKSLNKEGSVAFKAVVDGEILGGAIVSIDEKTQHNHLEFLYVKYGSQSKGIGKKLWNEIELMYPETKVWETFTPYFEKRNIHFYINCLGFHAVEFYDSHHKDPNSPDDMIGGDYFFRFEKIVKPFWLK